jgi:hypothetical protein
MFGAKMCSFACTFRACLHAAPSLSALCLSCAFVACTFKIDAYTHNCSKSLQRIPDACFMYTCACYNALARLQHDCPSYTYMLCEWLYVLMNTRLVAQANVYAYVCKVGIQLILMHAIFYFQNFLGKHACVSLKSMPRQAYVCTLVGAHPTNFCSVQNV